MPVNVIGTLKPKNNGKFPVAEAVDIKVTDDLRLDKALENKADLSSVNYALNNKADKTIAANLQAQIDELITPVTEDAEVQNARVGADGTNYPTLKARLDNAENQTNTFAYVISKSNLESGTWQLGNQVADLKRLRSKTKIAAPIGSIIEIDTKNLYVLIAQYETESSEDADNTGWLHGNHTVVIENPYFTIIVANGSTWNTSTTIGVDDYNCDISCLKSNFSVFAKNEDVSLLNSKIVSANEDISAISQTIAVDSPLNIKWISSYANGGLSQDGSLNSQKYRVSSTEFVSYTEDISITSKQGYKFGYVDSNSVWHGWYTTTAVIPKNTSFKLQLAKEPEDTTLYADVETFVNSYNTVSIFTKLIEEGQFVSKPLTDYTLWLQGTIAESGAIDPTHTKRCRTGEYISYSPDIVIKLTNSDFKYGLHFYNENYTHIGNTDWIKDKNRQIDDIPNCAYIKLVVAYSNNNNITPEDIPDDLILISYSVDKYVDISIKTATKPLPYTYIGEKIPSVNRFDASQIMALSYPAGNTSQDIEVYEGYLFVAFSSETAETIKIYNLSNYEQLASLEVTVHHGSGMQFSNEFYDENDEFPLLYVGGWTENLISVIRILHDNNEWTATVIRTIKLPFDYGYYLSPSIDKERNILYAYGHTVNNIQEGAPMIISKWDLTELTQNEDLTYTPDFISSCLSPNIGTYQGHKYLYGNIYIGTTQDNFTKQKMIALDANSGDIKTTVDLTSILAQEIEGLCYNVDTTGIEWYCSSWYKVVKLQFD